MLIQFTLSMPSNNAWNGRWSGEDNLYAVVRSTRAVESVGKRVIETGYWTHNFGDGWMAGVSAKEIDAGEARKVRKKSRGFCGYDWMVNSIMMFGEIRD